jgi:hypothetical protein
VAADKSLARIQTKTRGHVAKAAGGSEGNGKK